MMGSMTSARGGAALAFILAVVAGVPAAAQNHDHSGHHEHAGKEAREIKALSPEDVAGLLAGEGMGLALAAELNGWPGPRHVLELAEPLGLSAEVVGAVAAVRARMHARATQLGEAVVEAERTLDRRFAHRHIDADVVAELTSEIGRLRGELRAVHLLAHLETTALLTPEQVLRYDELRGYR
jgi:hypothetical protein